MYFDVVRAVRSRWPNRRSGGLIIQPIRSRLTLAGVLLISGIIAEFGLIIFMQREASVAASTTATANLGTAMARQTAQAIGAADATLRALQERLTDPAGSTARALLAQHAHLPGVAALMLAGADGQIVATTPPDAPPEPVSIADTEVYRHLRTTSAPGLFVGTPRQDAGGVWTVTMARRLIDKHGSFAGVALAALSLSDLQALFHLAMPPRRAVYLLRRDGLILLRYPAREAEIGLKIPSQSPWHAVAATGGNYTGSEYFNNVRVIAAVRPLPGLPFVVETSVPESDTLSAWYQQRVWVVFGGVAAIVCVVILLRLFAVQYERVAASEQTLAVRNAELDFAHGQLGATLAHLVQGVCFYNENNELLVFNKRFCDLFDLPEDAVRPGLTLREIALLRLAYGSMAVDNLDDYLTEIDAIMAAGQPNDRILELTNGNVLAGHCEPLPGRGWVVTYEDITKRRQAEAEIAHLAHHDALTGLANRALFQDRLARAATQTNRDKAFAVLCLDLDRFKDINDSLGHAAGDALLREVASRLRQVVRGGDTIARLGGDEFTVLLLDVRTIAEPAAVATRIIEAIGQPFDIENHQVGVGVSIGIATCPRDSTSPDQLMRCADLALYRCKQDGRGVYRFFEPAMDAIATARRALERDLEAALSLGQLELHYQPLVRGIDRAATGFEALLRWRHPTRGLVPPADFIPLAEEIGLISEIGGWVLRNACRTAAAWPDNLRVAVNLSPRQFRGHALVGTVAEAMQAAQLDPDRLELEITESVPLQKDQATLSQLRNLHALGVRITLDDFGTGYSSLSYLRAFPFDTIKIDRAFVSDLKTSGQSLAIVQAILGLAKSLQMNVTAEGVETEEQFAFLVAAGCSEIQGYLISRPVPAAAVPDLLARLSGRLPPDTVRLLAAG